MAFLKVDGKLHKINGKNIETTDWETIPLELWNCTTLRSYITYLNLEAFGEAPRTNIIQAENRTMTRDIKAHGIDVVKRYVELFVENYKPNNTYKALSYSQMAVFDKLAKDSEKMFPKALNGVKSLREAREEAIPLDEMTF